MLASIPSPSFNVFHIGPLAIHIYGIIMGIAVATAFVVVTSRYEKLGGDRKVAESAGFWCIVVGFIGARAAFVLPRLGDYSHDWLGVFRIWEGGIALFGGLTLGLLTAIFVVRRRDGSFWMYADAAAVALPAAQAIGRWGNYFNQELFGTPTSLPWGLEISPENRPVKYLDAETFHPTFLYEMLWNIGIIVLLLWLERHRKLRRGVLFGLYAVLYAVGRFLLELIRTDSPSRYFGLSRNGWYSLLVVLAGIGLLIWIQRRKPAPVEEAPVEEAPVEEAPVEEAPVEEAPVEEAPAAAGGEAAEAKGGAVDET
jgi:prolipoprotein diacylglyceryl transferase